MCFTIFSPKTMIHAIAKKNKQHLANPTRNDSLDTSFPLNVPFGIWRDAMVPHTKLSNHHVFSNRGLACFPLRMYFVDFSS